MFCVCVVNFIKKKKKNKAGTEILYGSVNVFLSHGKGSVLGISIPGNFTVRKYANGFGHLRMTPLYGAAVVQQW